MTLSKINDYINPFSNGFAEAAKKFDKLTTGQQVGTVLLTVFAGLGTIFLGGIGGWATFKALVNRFTAKPLHLGDNPIADRTSQAAQPVFSKSVKDLNDRALILAYIHNTDEISEIEQELEQRSKMNWMPGRLNMHHLDTHLKAVAKKLPIDNLIDVCTSSLTFKHQSCGAELQDRLRIMKEADIQKLLQSLQMKPQQFDFIAHLIGKNIESIAEYADTMYPHVHIYPLDPSINRLQYQQQEIDRRSFIIEQVRQKFGIQVQPIDEDVTKLSIGELIERCAQTPIQSLVMGSFFQEGPVPPTFDEISSRIEKMQEPERKALLEKIQTNSNQLDFVAYIIGMHTPFLQEEIPIYINDKFPNIQNTLGTLENAVLPDTPDILMKRMDLAKALLEFTIKRIKEHYGIA